MRIKNRIVNVLFWSVVSAAFIGPGTITTAAKSGAAFGVQLLWSLLFSTLACLVLQEASARLTIASGKNLGQAIVHQYQNKKSQLAVLILVLGAIVIGAAAYEMGNLIGAVAGVRIIFGLPSWMLVLAIAAMAALILSIPSLKIIATIMGIVVGLMGLIFLVTALMVPVEWLGLLQGMVVPQIPARPEAGLLVLGLIGTTIVPYNLFLGSGLAVKEQHIAEMRFGLAVAIVLGGIFSMAVLVVGTAVSGEFSFAGLALALTERIGVSGKYMLGFGLFAAGFTSAITAPLASAITIKSLFGNDVGDRWKERSWRFRSGWLAVLLTGLLFALTDVKPIPAIIVAQAFNGLLLPFVSVFLFWAINNKALMGDRQVNGPFLNGVTLVIIAVTILIGCINIAKVIANLFSLTAATDRLLLPILLLSIAITFLIWMKTKRT